MADLYTANISRDFTGTLEDSWWMIRVEYSTVFLHQHSFEFSTQPKAGAVTLQKFPALFINFTFSGVYP